MTIKRKMFSFATTFLKRSINLVGGNLASSISAELAEKLSPTISQQTKFGIVYFFCPGKIPEWRAQTLLTKEPETLEWIETFHDADLLWDIGANVGVYSLYAALKGNSVLAFEPSPGNFYLLSQNIGINSLSDKIAAYCIAFDDSTKLETFYMANAEIGGALSSFGEAIDWQGKPFKASLKQAMVGFCIDDFVERFQPKFPNHIKIDVDGNENRIIDGAKKTLLDKRLKSVLVELNTEREDYCSEVLNIFNESGFSLLKKEHSSAYDSSNLSMVFNHIFVR